MSHTPGPWTLETVKTSVGHCHKIGPFPTASGSRKETYACVYVDGLGLKPESAPELLANARLIAAAPELLVACQSVIAWFELLKADLRKKLVLGQTLQSAAKNWNTLMQEPLDLEPIMAAIAKAEGQQ